MKVIVTKEHRYNVHIYDMGTVPFIDLSLSPQKAYELLLALDLKHEELRDLANNFWDCPDCGNTHPKSMQDCPNVAEEE